MSLLTIWIDADSCPAPVRNHAVKMGNKLNVQVVFAANKNIPCNINLPFTMKICGQEKDAADNFIFQNVQPFDMVITRDIVFADRLIQKGICTINDRGTSFNSENIKKLLSDRDFDLQLSEIGLVKHYNEGYDKKKFASFANCFDREINRLIKSAKIK